MPEYQDQKMRRARPIISTSASPEDLHRKLALALKSPTATLAEVKANLLALRPWLVGLDSKIRHSEAIKYLAGAKTLRWAWDKNLHMSPDLLGDHAMLQTLAIFLVAEKMDHFMNDWLFVDLPEANRNLVDAEIILAEPKGKSFDAAIGRLFAILDQPADFPRGSPQRTMSAWPAVLPITAIITSADCSRTNVRLYERLLRFVAEFDTSKTKMQDFSLAARLALWHPARPDAVPFVTSFKEALERGSEPKLVMCDDTRGRTKLMRLIDRALELLDLPHQQADREWLQRTRTKLEAEFAQAWQANTNRQYMRGEVGQAFGLTTVVPPRDTWPSIPATTLLTSGPTRHDSITMRPTSWLRETPDLGTERVRESERTIHGRFKAMS